LLREGKPAATIAQELGISSKTVQRVIRQAIP
jgi:DNA-binding NarL/FixJ family response regulator